MSTSLFSFWLLKGGILVFTMSKLEDPAITVKQAMVVTAYPGASAYQVELEVTDVLEKAIRSMGTWIMFPLVRWMTCRRLW